MRPLEPLLRERLFRSQSVKENGVNQLQFFHLVSISEQYVHFMKLLFVHGFFHFIMLKWMTYLPTTLFSKERLQGSYCHIILMLYRGIFPSKMVDHGYAPDRIKFKITCLEQQGLSRSLKFSGRSFETKVLLKTRQFES